MNWTIKGLHHVTATVEDPHEDLDFYVRLLGLRLVKKTVNFDNPGVYHFYYGNAHGSPGTIMTTFPYGGKGVRPGERGTGQITVTSFSVPKGSLDFWRERLRNAGLDIRESGTHFDEEVIEFDDPSGLEIELIACDDPRRPWEGSVEGAHAVRGVHSVTLELRNLTPTVTLFEDVFGFRVDCEDENCVCLAVGEGGPGRLLHLLPAPSAPAGVNGIGTVHHVALAVATEEEQLEIQSELRRRGLNVTDVRDRQYFRSIYFREPGGVLIEVATEGPGFLVDEDEHSLGQGLKLPPWEEHRRALIESQLPAVAVEQSA